MRVSPYLYENFKEMKSFGLDYWSDSQAKGNLRDDLTEARHSDYSTQKEARLQDIQQNLEKNICGLCKIIIDGEITIKCRAIVTFFLIFCKIV